MDNHENLPACSNEGGNRNDCVVRAIRDATGLPYERIAIALCKAAKRDPNEPIRSGFHSFQYEAAMKELGIEFEERDTYFTNHVAMTDRGRDVGSNPTVTRWLRDNGIHHKHPVLIRVKNHLLCASKGKLNDSTGRRARVRGLYVLTGCKPVDLEGRNAEKAAKHGTRTTREKFATAEDLHRWISAMIDSGHQPVGYCRYGRPQLEVNHFLRWARHQGRACGWKRMYEALLIEAVKCGWDEDDLGKDY